MNKPDMSLGEYCKKLGIDKDHIYIASKEDPTDFPRKVGHKDEQILAVKIEEAKDDELINVLEFNNAEI